MKYQFIILNIICSLFNHWNEAQGQRLYNLSDSVRIFSLLDKADIFDLNGELDSALVLTQQVEQSSRNLNFKRGISYALLKKADLLLKTQGTDRQVITLCEQGIEVGREINDRFLIGLGYHQLGQFYRDLSIWDSAFIQYKQASTYYNDPAFKNYQAIIQNDIAFVHEKKGNYVLAVDYNLKAIQLFEELSNVKEQANTMGNLGIIYYRMGDKPKAIELFKQSARLRETISDIKGLAAIYGNLATAYTNTSVDSAIRYQILALKNATRTGVLSNIAQANANASALLSKQNKYQEAIPYEKEALKLYEQMGDQTKLAPRHIALAALYKSLGDSMQVEKHFEKAESIARGMNSKPILQNLHLQKSVFYQAEENFKKALSHIDSYHKYKDSLFNEKTISNIAELQTKYDTEKKDNEITRLTLDQKVKQLELSNQKALVQTKNLESKNLQNQIKILEQEATINQNEQLQHQALMERKEQESQLRESNLTREKLLIQNKARQQRWIRNSLIAGLLVLVMLGLILFNRYQLTQKIKLQDRILSMRNNLSKDLHDEIGSTLTSIAILSHKGQQTLVKQPDLVPAVLSNIASQSKSVQQNMSDIIWAIRPDTDKTSSLIARIREHLSSLDQDDLHMNLHADERLLNQSLNEIKRKEILLIIKEALNNIVKHSGATSVDINFSQQDHQLSIDITDNGQWNSKNESTGTGLISMRERASKIGGTCRILHHEHGTQVLLQIPGKI